jgi:hypothetical protein
MAGSNEGADLDYGPRGPQHRDNLRLRLTTIFDADKTKTLTALRLRE